MRNFFKKSFIPSRRRSTRPLSIWKRHSILYPTVSSGGLFASSILMSGWCGSHRPFMKTPEAVCALAKNLREEFSVKMGFYQVSCLSPLLFITVLEALSQEFRTGCPRESLYVENMVIITKSLEELQQKLMLWKTNMKGKGLRVNLGKTKVLLSGLGLDVLQKPDKQRCVMCLNGVRTNSIFCGVFSTIKCRDIPGRLKSDASFRCKRCTGQARPLDNRLMTEVTVSREKLDVVPSFC